MNMGCKSDPQANGRGVTNVLQNPCMRAIGDIYIYQKRIIIFNYIQSLIYLSLSQKMKKCRSRQSQMKQNNMVLKIVLEFVEAINSANIDRLIGLLGKDHVFIDSRGTRMTGNDQLKEAWIGYFLLFPDYKIEIEDTFQNKAMIVLTGYASGTYKAAGKNLAVSNHWRIPASWKAVVVNDKIGLWQVYADNGVVSESIGRNLDILQ